MLKVFSIFLLLFFSLSSHGEEGRPTQTENKKIQIDQLVAACISQQKKDQVCEGLIKLKQIGDDAVEAIKEYVQLGPFEYAVVTAANYAINGRLRIRSRSFLYKKAEHTYDYKKDGSVEFTISWNF